MLGPKTDCEFYERGWCKRTHVEAVISSYEKRQATGKEPITHNLLPLPTAVCKMRKRLPTWLDDIPNCPCVAIPVRCSDDVLYEAHKKRGTEEEAMLNCVLSKKGGNDCVNYRPETALTGKCSQDYISCHRIRGKEWCDQYKEEPLRCAACGVDTRKTVGGNHRLVGDTVPCPTVLCIYCHDVYNSLTRNGYGSTVAMNMLKELVNRARENKQQSTEPKPHFIA